MGRTSGMREGQKIYVHVSVGKPKGKKISERLKLRWKDTIKIIFQKYDGRSRIWLRIGTSGGLL
jgi:hypothetical protein